MGETAITFPCKALPEEARIQRLLGIYPMRQEGLFMQRVKVPGGRIELPQWRLLAKLASEHTPEYPLHVTTRQDVELHGLSPSQIPLVQEALNAAGLTTARACGDTVRNIVCCPGSGLCDTGADVLPLAAAIILACETRPFIHSLPRKFKIGLSACERCCGRPWIQDVGLVCLDGRNFRAIVGGSLGPRPGTGTEYRKTLALNEVVPFVLAALRLFNEEGDRKVRGRARLRHVRERLGDQAFLARLEAAFLDELDRSDAPVPPQPFPPEGRALRAHLKLPLGDIAPEAALELASAAETAEALLRIGLDHDLLLYGYKPLVLPNKLGVLAKGPVVISCPGTTWCARGVADSRATAQRIADRLHAADGLRICISGCPNNCAQSAVADIGLVGCVRTCAGVRGEGFRLLAGGGNGTTERLALELSPFVPADRAPEVVRRLIEEYAKAGSDYCGGFAGFFEREKVRLAAALAETAEGSAGRSTAREPGPGVRETSDEVDPYE